MPEETPQGNPTRARDYVNDIERWTFHAKEQLRQFRPQAALTALDNASIALKKAIEYLRTGQEQHRHIIPEGDSNA